MDAFLGKNYSSVLKFLFVHCVVMMIIPWDHKWIKITLENGEIYKYYFYGLEWDYHENSEEVLFEDMFMALSRKGYKVKWKSDNIV